MTSTAEAAVMDPNAVRPLVAVGFDGTDCAHAAVRWAALEAAARGANLRVVTAWDPSPINPWTLPYLDEWRTEARERAETAAANAHRIAGPGVRTEAVVVEGTPGQVMVGQSENTDLLVVGSAGHVGLAGMFSGSVSRRLLHRAHGPVVILGPEAAPDAVRRVVLSSTLDPEGETFGWVADWLRGRAVPVHVLGSFAFTANLPELQVTDVQRQVRGSVSEQNADWVERLREVLPADAEVSTEILEGETLDVLRDHTAEGDLLVVPSGCEHSVPLAHGRCAIAFVPNPAVAVAKSADR